MAYTYTALVSYFGATDRLVNLTEAATVTAYNALTGDTITGATITNVRVGVYRVAVTSATLTDVLFSAVPAVADQAAYPDVAVMQEKVYHVADDISAKTALEATLTAIKGAGWTDETLVALKTAIATVQADLDNPNQYKADVSGLAPANEYDVALAALQLSVDGIDVGDILSEVLENGLTVAEVLRIMLSTLAGKLSGAGTGTLRFRDMADTMDRVVATMDADHNRTNVVRDGS